MNQLLKKTIGLLLAAALCMSALCGCGAKPGEEAVAEAKEEAAAQAGEAAAAENGETAAAEPKEEAAAQLANPWTEITEEEARENCYPLFRVPDGAEVQAWTMCRAAGDPAAGTGPLIQLKFALDGMDFTARAQQGAAEDADLSGVYEQWTAGPDDVTLTNRGGGRAPGKTYRAIHEAETVDLITWHDAGAGYSLTVAAADLDGFDIQAVAEQMAVFTYAHDPRENPEAMKDIVVNPDAVYGFSPDPQSERLGTYADYDWTDPAFTAKAKEDRRAYHEAMDSMTDILYRMRDEGATIEEMARAVSEERNRIRLAAYDGDPEGLAKTKESNLKTYGHEDGPTPDQLYEKYGSWTTVLQKAFSANLGMDACCGLYDEYYPLYIELGYAE